MTIPAYILPSTGDRLMDLRRVERAAWHNYLRVAETLAKTPPSSARENRDREKGAKRAWADALKALDNETKGEQT